MENMTSPNQQTTTLHILNKAPEHPRFEACMNALCPEDILVLSESAVLALADQNAAIPENSLALAPDLAARGLEADFEKQAISYQDLVRLTEEHPRIISW
ncbi:MAG: sulfurtransferase complex subunit TusB [Pseudomonadota bacterium]